MRSKAFMSWIHDSKISIAVICAPVTHLTSAEEKWGEFINYAVKMLALLFGIFRNILLECYACIPLPNSVRAFSILSLLWFSADQIFREDLFRPMYHRYLANGFLIRLELSKASSLILWMMRNAYSNRRKLLSCIIVSGTSLEVEWLVCAIRASSQHSRTSVMHL